MPRVDFHTHSTLSDGALTPVELAARMAAQGVAYAALTDHDSVAGAVRFREALSHKGIACVEGVELTTVSEHGETHILAYSLGPDSPGIAALVAEARAGARAQAARRQEVPRPSNQLTVWPMAART